jgi:PAS domain S-box-containing protein
LYPPDEWEKIRNENVRQKGIRYRMETRMLRKNIEPFDVDLSICILKGFKGEIVGSVAIITDITELKKVEKELKESEKKYRTIFNNSAVAITMTDENEKIISWNKYAELLLGMNKDDLYLKPVRDLYPVSEWQKIRSQNVRQKGMQHHLETKIQKKDNQQIDVDISLSVLKNHEDKVVGSIGVMKDISEQKRTERNLEESEKKFKLLYEKAPVPYHTLSPEGLITDVNEKWCQIFGYSKEEVLGKSIFDFISANEKILAQKSFAQKMSEGKSYTGGREREYRTKSGEKKLFINHDFFMFDENGKVIAIHTTMEDITENKKAEQALKEKISELERYKVITVNREMKMMELKNEINELHSQLHQKPKY